MPIGELLAIREAKQHEDLVLTVAVAVDEPFALEDLRERLELEVDAGRHGAGLLVLRKRRVAHLLLPIPTRGLEVVVEERFDAHARLRIAAAWTHHVLAEGELDAVGASSKRSRLASVAPSDLDDAVLAADRVRGSVQLVRDGEPAGKLPVPVDVVGIDDVGDPDLRTGFRVHSLTPPKSPVWLWQSMRPGVTWRPERSSMRGSLPSANFHSRRGPA